MPKNTAITTEQIRKAAEIIKQARPAYTAMLEFYEQIFTAQKDAESRTHIPPLQVSEEMLRGRAAENIPLLRMSEFAIDTEVSESLFREICLMTEKADNHLSADAGNIRQAADSKRIDPKILFTALLNEDDACFANISCELESDKKTIAFIVFNSIEPSLCLCAEQVAGCRGQVAGFCPICGSKPMISCLDGQGERFLICGFCRHKWEIQRIFCPFCENTDSKSLHYFYTEEEKEYRTDVCEKCKSYIKTVDIRKMNRVFYPPLEQIASLHLDIKANELRIEK
jgi:FdhE protein